MKIHLRSVAPTTRELALCSVSALFVALLGNSVQLYNYYKHGISPLNLHGNVSAVTVSIASRIDSYRPSTAIITFLLWAIVGLAVLALLQGARHAIERAAYLHFVSSKRFRRKLPPAFSVAAFWKQLFLTSVGSFAAFCIALFILSLITLCIMPVGLLYSREFFFAPTVANMFYGLMGLAMVFAGLLLLTVAVRLVYHRRRLVRLA